jgi:hypothetical protein
LSVPAPVISLHFLAALPKKFESGSDEPDSPPEGACHAGTGRRNFWAKYLSQITGLVAIPNAQSKPEYGPAQLLTFG